MALTFENLEQCPRGRGVGDEGVAGEELEEGFGEGVAGGVEGGGGGGGGLEDFVIILLK
jgi:hypothetical protein